VTVYYYRLNVHSTTATLEEAIYMQTILVSVAGELITVFRIGAVSQ